MTYVLGTIAVLVMFFILLMAGSLLCDVVLDLLIGDEDGDE